MIKELFTTILIAFFSIGGVAQTTLEKVEDFLGTQKYMEYQTSNPGLISYLKVKVEEGFVISEAIPTKKESYISINTVFYKKEEIPLTFLLEELNTDSFNILNYSFLNQDSNKTCHYLLGDTNILLTVYSNNVINKKVEPQH